MEITGTERITTRIGWKKYFQNNDWKDKRANENAIIKDIPNPNNPRRIVAAKVK